MGTDLLDKFKNWTKGEDLNKSTEFIILKRIGYNPPIENYPDKYRILDTNIEGSSTSIRNRIREQIETRNKINLGINGLTTTSVIQYIKEHGLYLTKSC